MKNGYGHACVDLMCGWMTRNCPRADKTDGWPSCHRCDLFAERQLHSHALDDSSCVDSSYDGYFASVSLSMIPETAGKTRGGGETDGYGRSPPHAREYRAQGEEGGENKRKQKMSKTKRT